MRTPVSRAATGAVRLFAREHPPSISSRTFRARYLCAACRAATQQPRIQYPPPPVRRAFSTTAYVLNNNNINNNNTTTTTTTSSASSSSSSSSTRSPPHASSTDSSPAPAQQRTHYTLFPKTFAAGPPPASPFLPDLRALRAEFLALQTQTHPDRFPAGARKHAAEAASAALNEAYRTLADPLRHANYLLGQHGVDTEDEGAKLSDAALLMEVMEAREEVDAAASEAELAPLREANAARIAARVAALERLVAARDWQAAGGEAVRLRYWRNVDESIRGWEEGHGGGAMHH